MRYGYTALNGVMNNAYVAAFIAGWASLFISAILCAVELAIAGTFPLDLGLTFMGTYHAVIGLIEGGITAVALYLIASARPDILERPEGVTA
jgi:cobalt/nickel transport system permease protein